MRKFGAKVTYIEVNDNDVDDLVKETYGKDFECACSEEMSNGTRMNISVEFGKPLYEWDQKKIIEFKATGRYSFALRTLFQDMVNNKVIKPGNYLVECSW